MTHCTPTKRARIVTLRNRGLKFAEISNELGLHPSTVSRNYRKFHKKRDFYRKTGGGGRPRLLTPRDLRHAERLIISGEARDGSDVRRLLFPHVGASTIRRNLCEIGLNGRVRRAKPFLKDEHINKRKRWADEHGDWEEEDWRMVSFADESKFNLFGSDGRQYCRRRPNEELLPRNVKKTVKHGGGSLQVWGCLTWNGTGRLHRVSGNMDAAQYCSILSESFLGTLSDHSLNPSDIVLAQDNDPKHKSRRAAKWFADNNIKLLPWAPSSADMNIIEHAWDILDKRVRARPVLPRNLDELWTALVEEWAAIDVETVRNLYRSMPRRVQALKEAKGAYTRY